MRRFATNMLIADLDNGNRIVGLSRLSDLLSTRLAIGPFKG